jgi:hypothetical protein
MVGPAPVVADQAAVFRDRCDHPRQFRPFPPDVTGLIVLPNTRMAHIARGVLARAENTHRSRVLAEAPWRQDAGNRRRRRCRLQPSTPHRRRRRASRVVREDTRCDPGGSRVADVDRHAHHRAGPSPLAHNPVTRVSVRGPGRVPRGRRR